jgi:hypothetical protein
MPRFGSHEWLMNILLRRTSAAVTAPMKKPSAIWIYEAATRRRTRASVRAS